MANGENIRRRPISTLTTQILLALLDRDRYGYEILKEIELQTDGAMSPRTASLYAALHRLDAEGLVREAPEAADPGEDERRTYYALTPEGREALRAEAVRMSRVVDAARERMLLPDPTGAPEPTSR